MHFDWSAVNTALLMGALAYLWRQARMVDELKQALLGIKGRGGALADIERLDTRMQELTTTLAVLNTTVNLLTKTLESQP